jgi:hypothetical protein
MRRKTQPKERFEQILWRLRFVKRKEEHNLTI